MLSQIVNHEAKTDKMEVCIHHQDKQIIKRKNIKAAKAEKYHFQKIKD